MLNAIGVDIGGGSTKIGLVSPQGEVLERSRIEAVESETGDAFLARLDAALLALLARGAVSGIGIGYPGPVHPGNMSGGIGNVPGLIDYPLAQAITSRLGLPARMENDATAAALAEVRFGAGQGSARMLMVTAGTGIGVAMILDGSALVTSGGCLGDAGHIIVDGGSSRRCRLGCTGCLEALASSEALDDLVAHHAARHPQGELARHAIIDHTGANAALLIWCALAGDAQSQVLLAEAGSWIGRAVASWVHTFAPDIVVIGGGLSAAGAFLLMPIFAEVRRCGLPSYTANLRIVPAARGNDAGIIGAASQFLRRD